MNRLEAEQESIGLEPEWTIMVHPELEDSYSKVTVPAYEEVWRDKGWQRAEGLLDEDGQPASYNEPKVVTPQSKVEVKQPATGGPDNALSPNKEKE